MLRTALTLAAKGFAVFPYGVAAKVPATAHGSKDATTDTDLIRQWWFRDLRWLLKRLLRQHQLHCPSLRDTGGRAYGRDRASIVAAGVMQIVATASEHERQQTIADYLRDDERQPRTDLDIPD
jgi:Bifunctional DNA primase/polymerase, N-terminal